MLDINKIPDSIISSLKKRGNTKEDIEQMTPQQAFREYCNWYGLRGWGKTLLEVYGFLKSAAKEQE